MSKYDKKVLWSLTVPIAIVTIAAFVVVLDARGPALALAFGVLGAFVLAASVGYVRRYLRLAEFRVRQARTAAERIAQGHYDRLPLEADVELAGLAAAFNSMTDSLSARENALREETQALAVVNRRMEAALNASDDGIALLDRAGFVVLVNPRFCEMLGLRRDAVLLENIADLGGELAERFREPAQLIALLDPAGDSGEIISERTVEIAKGGSVLQIYSAPVRDDIGELNGRIVAFHDVTRERELEKMKDEFISVVSHELRTPLTSIKGYTDLLVSGATGEINEIQQEFLGIIQVSANRLANLINDILDISRIESGRLEVRQDAVDYQRVVSDALRVMKAPADEKDIMLEASLPSEWPAIRGDTDKITQILSNLLSNAIKYTHNGGFVKLMIDVSDTTVTTCVVDTGIGITAEDQKKLFQKFFRADNSLTREAGGTGLGLVIVKTMVELLGGTIWVESESGQEEEFYFSLPRFDAPAVEEASNRRTVPASDRGIGVVMVVDDQAYARDLLQHSLHRRGYSVLLVDNADEAVDDARQHSPDAILIDMMMPKMAAFDVLRGLVSSPSSATTPIVAYSLAGDPVRGNVLLGAFSVMQKPVDPAAIAGSLSDSLEHKPTILVVACDSQPGDADISVLVEGLEANGACAITALSSSQAITRVVSEPVDAIIIDIDHGEPEAVFELMRALKSEEDVARLPTILVTNTMSSASIQYHLGVGAVDATASIEYLVEQVSRAMA